MSNRGRPCTANMPRRAGPRIVACLVLGASAGCSTAASISRVSGPSFDAEILGSDAKSLRVRDDYGREFLVPREDVADIDHPGNVLCTIGAVLMAMSVPWFVAALAGRRAQSQQSEWVGLELVFAIPEAVTGLSLAIPGWNRHRHSKLGAKAFEDANPILPIPRPATYPPNPYPPLPSYPPPYPYPPQSDPIRGELHLRGLPLSTTRGGRYASPLPLARLLGLGRR